MKDFIIIAIPFLGTVLGSAMVFFMKKEMDAKLGKLLLGFASGVMIAASVWSLLIPAFELSEGKALPSFVPVASGFLLGIAFLLILDRVIPHQHLNSAEPEGIRSGFRQNTMLMLAVTLHNIPEGMAVGVPYLFSFAAGAMLYVVVEELIPEMSQGKHSNIGTIFFAVGFSVMMTLDVALG